MNFTSDIICPNCGLEFDALDVIENISDTFFASDKPNDSKHSITCPECGEKFEVNINY